MENDPEWANCQVKESGFDFIKVRQAGTHDPLLQCLLLDRRLFEHQE